MKCRKIESIRDISNNIISISKSSDMKLDFAFDFSRLYNLNILSKHFYKVMSVSDNVRRLLLYTLDESVIFDLRNNNIGEYNKQILNRWWLQSNRNIKTLKDYKKERGE